MKFHARWLFVDEPRIPCGERGVIVQVGPKWVRFRDIAFEKATGTRRTAKVRREIYDLTKDLRLIRIVRKVGPDR
jgi:hypothetical protein